MSVLFILYFGKTCLLCLCLKYINSIQIKFLIILEGDYFRVVLLWGHCSAKHVNWYEKSQHPTMTHRSERLIIVWLSRSSKHKTNYILFTVATLSKRRWDASQEVRLSDCSVTSWRSLFFPPPTKLHQCSGYFYLTTVGKYFSHLCLGLWDFCLIFFLGRKPKQESLGRSGSVVHCSSSNESPRRCTAVESIVYKKILLSF